MRKSQGRLYQLPETYSADEKKTTQSEVSVRSQVVPRTLISLRGLEEKQDREPRFQSRDRQKVPTT
jgi:hypothetical protein